MTSLKGNLNSVDLANIFQMLTLNQREGTLYIFEGASRKAIYFGAGGASMLTKGNSKSDALGRILLRYDRLTPEELERAIQRKCESGRLLGQVLVEEHICSRADIDEALQIQIQEEVYSLFIWKDAQFEFVEGPPDEEFGADGVHRLGFNVNSVIMEAARRVDEWGWIQGIVPETAEIYRYTNHNVPLTDPIFQEPFAGKVLAAIDGRRSIDDVVVSSYVNRFEVCKILAILSDAGAIERLPVPELRGAADEAVASGDTASAVKFLSRLVAANGDAPEMHERLAKAFEREHELANAARHYRVFADSLAASGRMQEAFAVERHIAIALPTDLAAAERMIELYASHPEGLDQHAGEIVARGKSLAEIYVELKRASRALHVLHRVVALAPEDQDLRNRLIAVYLAANMTTEAMTEYEALAETAAASGDFAGAEKMLRKVLTIDRGREDVQRRVEVLVAKQKRRKRNMKALTIAGVTVLVFAVAGWFGWSWHRETKAAERQRELASEAGFGELRTAAGPLRTTLEQLVKELAVRPVDLTELAAALRARRAAAAAIEKDANATLSALSAFRGEYQGLPADDEALDLSNEISGRLSSVKRTFIDIERSLKDNAEISFTQAQQMLGRGESTRGALERAQFAVKLGSDAGDWLVSESGQRCAGLERDLLACVTKFESVKAAVQAKAADNDADAAFDLAVGYLTATDFPPADLRADMPLYVRIISRPPGAHILTKDGVDTGFVAGPSCIVPISIVKGASFDLELPGFRRATLTIVPITALVPATVREKLQRSYDVLLEKSQAFRKATSDSRPVTAAPFASDRFAVIPSNRACDVVDLAAHEIVSTLSLNGDRSVRAAGLVLDQAGGGSIVVIPTGDGCLMFFDAASGRLLGAWNETRGGLVFDLALCGDTVIAADDRGTVSCVGIASRDKRWSHAVRGSGGEMMSVSAAPVVAGDEVFVPCEDGSVEVLDAAQGTRRRSLPAPAGGQGRVNAPVSVRGGAAYVVTRDGTRQSRVTRWALAANRSDWSVIVPGEIRSAALTNDGTVFAVSTTGEVTGLKAADGSRTNSGAADRAVKMPGDATISDGVIYVGCDNGVLYALDVRGPEIEPLWRFPVKNGSGKPVAVTTRTVFAGGLLLFGGSDGALYALDGGK